MKPKQKKPKPTLSDKIADALTVKPRADIEDDHVFHTKPKTLTRADLSSSDSEDEAAISDFRKRNVNLLSDISKKYEGTVSRRNLKSSSEGSDSETQGKDTKDRSVVADSDDTDNKSKEDSVVSDDESDDYSITQFKKQLESDESGQSGEDSNEDSGEDGEDDDGEGYDISQMEEPVKEEFEHVKKQNVSEEAKKGNSVRNQLLLWEGLLEMRIHLQRCMNTANKMPMSGCYGQLKQNNEFVEETVSTVNNVTNVLER